MNGHGHWTTVWKWTVRVRDGLHGEGQRGKNSDNCNRISKNKNKFKKNIVNIILMMNVRNIL